MPQDPPIWDDIRHAFEHSYETVDVISRRFSVTVNQIKYRARARGWTSRPSGREALTIASFKRRLGLKRPSYAEPLTAPEQKSKCVAGLSASKAGTLTHRRAIIVRFYDVIDAKLADIERRIASDRSLDASAAEREAREIATLIKNFEKLTELSDAHDARSAKRSSATDTGADDSERLRQDLIQRLERIRAANRDRPVARKDDTEIPRSPEP